MAFNFQMFAFYDMNLINKFEVATFLFHQAAEKALKALYILKFKMGEIYFQKSIAIWI